MNPKHCLACLVVLSLIILSRSAQAQSITMFPASPQANGRGGVYTSPDNADPLAPLSNPGLLGLMAEHNRIMVAFYVDKTQKEPDPLDSGDWVNGYRLTSRAVYLGFNRHDLGKWFKRDVPFSFGIGYHETGFVNPGLNDWGSRDEFSNSRRVEAESRGFSLALGAHYPNIEAGAGLNLKFIRRNAEPRTNTYVTDFGFYVHSPWQTPLTEGPGPCLFIAPALSYSLLNVGPLIPTAESPTGAPPERTAKFGLAFAAGLDSRNPMGDPWRVFSVEAGAEGEDLLVDYSHDAVRYQGALGDISPINDLILGDDNFKTTKRQGLEIGLIEAFYVRVGNYRLAEQVVSYGRGPLELHTKGFGFRLAGALKLLRGDATIHANRTVSFIAQHMDIQYDVSTITNLDYFHGNGPDWKYDEITYHGLTLLWK